MILCCGEALIDMVPMLGQDGEQGFSARCGGAVFNTAIALGRLECDVALLAGLSRDLFGRQLAAELKRSNVDHKYLVFSNRPSTLAFVQLEDGQASYSFFDENSAGRELSSAELPTISEEISCVFFGGISLISGKCAEAFTDLALRTSTDRVVMLDPNIRPGFVSNEVAFRKRLFRMIEHTDILKVSDEDLDWLLPTQDSFEQKAETLLRLGPSLVLVTCGGNGAYAFMSGKDAVRAEAISTKIADTVGAGDTFNAGVLAKLSELGLLTKNKLTNLDPARIKEALEFGNLAASVTVSRSGANPPSRSELTEFT
ncbi:carbohydrate kinase [Thalassobius sp. Cn5-15]|uniref:carbohydrate kinase family protein n=1 Tax=Thalassobius sp. Cn5-15 TaxID=2917763 RepID=UPI001EF3BBD6|nr:carbohydrate kinase [Thalassobius sp. Cn5-15]